jgi:hypothetical protein
MTCSAGRRRWESSCCSELRAQFTLALLDKLRGQGIGFASPGAPVFARQPPHDALKRA